MKQLTMPKYGSSQDDERTKMKYKMIPEGNLFRIKALGSFSNVKKGDFGGLIEKESNLSHEGDCWIYGAAQVYGSAKVYGDAKVYYNAKVFGNAQVYGHTRISGNAVVYHNAQIYDSAQVYGNAKVFGDAQVYGNVKVYDNAKIFGSAKVYGHTRISGNAVVFDSAQVFGNAQVFGDAQVRSKCSFTPVFIGTDKNRDITIIDSHIHIGYKFHTISQWKRFSDKAICKIDKDALGWWKVWKPIIFSIIERSNKNESN